MAAIFPFQLQGTQQGFLAATVAPAAVQLIASVGGATQAVITNTGVVTVYVITGQSAAACSVAASIGQAAGTIGTSIACMPVLAGSQISLTIPPNSWITGITATTIAACLAVPGEGI